MSITDNKVETNIDSLHILHIYIFTSHLTPAACFIARLGSASTWNHSPNTLAICNAKHSSIDTNAQPVKACTKLGSYIRSMTAYRSMIAMQKHTSS